MTDLKDLNLSDEDFSLLIQGLDALPQKDQAGEMMSDLIGTVLFDGKMKEEFERKRKQDLVKKQAAKDKLIEDTKILQGKLLMMKRFMQENNLMKDVNNILGDDRTN